MKLERNVSKPSIFRVIIGLLCLFIGLLLSVLLILSVINRNFDFQDLLITFFVIGLFIFGDYLLDIGAYEGKNGKASVKKVVFTLAKERNDAIFGFFKVVFYAGAFLYLLSPFGIILEIIGYKETAKICYHTTIFIDNENYIANEYLGNIYFYENDYNNAIVHYSRSINRKPSSIKLYYFRGNSLFYSGSYNDAISDLNVYIEKRPESERIVWAIFLRGIAKFYIEDFEGACADMKKSALMGNTDAEKIFNDYCNSNQ